MRGKEDSQDPRLAHGAVSPLLAPAPSLPTGARQARSGTKGPRLVALFLLGALLFNFPFLHLVDVPVEVLGIPLLYAYVFAVWALLIGLMALVLEGRGDD